MREHWLSRVPDDWHIYPIRRVTELKNTKVSGTSRDEGYIGLENIEPWTGRLLKSETTYESEPGDNDNTGVVARFEAGDVLFGKLRPYLAKVHLANGSGICTTELLVIKPHRRMDARFLLWVMLTSEFINQVNTETFGARMPRADWNAIGNLLIPVPPLSHQRAIADYLDRETAHIDALIAAKERLLKLLAEKRRAVITHAVTRGLNPDAPMRDSGVEWLGEIPSHWKVLKLRYLSTEPLAYGANEAGLEDNPNYPRFVRITDITDDGFLRDETFRSLPPDVAEPYLLKEGDILFARSGATVGKAFRYQKHWGTACFAGYLIRLRCATKLILPEFVFAFSQSLSYWIQIRAGTIQATIQNFSGDKFGDVLLPLPPLDEQEKIIDYLTTQEGKIITLAQATQKTKVLLHERRAALIAAAVSGQIDIRG